MKVLIVDDEAALLSSTSKLLGHLGFETATVSDAATILDRARGERPDVILQDIRMPGLDLDRLVAQLREDPATAKIPVVLCSASMDVAETAERLAVAAWIEKPYRPQDLIATLHRATAATVPV